MINLSDTLPQLAQPSSNQESLPATHCSFLFARQAIDLGLKEEETAEILQKLETRSLRAIRQGELFLFDALGGNDQCHLVALMISMVYLRFLEGNFKAQEKDRSSDSRLIQLAFVLSTLFFRNKENTLKALFAEESPATIKAMAHFIGNPSIMQEGKQRLAQIVDRYVQENLSFQMEKSKEPGRLLSELKELSKENLVIQYKHSTLGLFCYPKFTGVLLLLQIFNDIQIPIVFKIKVLCAKGQHLQVYCTGKDGKTLMQPNDLSTPHQGPALVVEGFAANEKIAAMDDYKLARAFCPHGLFSDKANAKIKIKTSDIERTGRIHANDASCALCLPCSDSDCPDLQLQSKRLERIEATAHDILRMIAADFTLECQPEYVKRFFTSSSSYPFLARLFQETHDQASKDGLTAKHPSTFLIEHVYSDTLEHALKSPRLLDSQPLSLIKKEAKE